MKRRTWKQLCGAGRHRYRGREHAAGCDALGDSHLHVRCRRPACGWGWLEPMLFDPRPYGVAA